MPIPAEVRKRFYGRAWRTEVRPRILKRAGYRCEQCGVPGGVAVLRAQGWWTPFDDSLLRFWYGSPDDVPPALLWTSDMRHAHVAGFPRSICRLVHIVLTIAHMNHTPGDDRDENLKALCQWCHLNYDKLHHAETRATRKDAARPLLQQSRAEQPACAHQR